MTLTVNKKTHLALHNLITSPTDTLTPRSTSLTITPHYTMDDSLSATETDSAPSPGSPQQQQQAGDKRFKIPSDLKKWQRTLLAASEVDWTLGTVEEIKCRLCPDAGFRTWLEFTRHCNMSEMHPRRISFCDRCGDFFARSDTLERHRKRPPSECLRVTRGMAEAKRRETERAYERFTDGLEQCLSSGKEVKPFSHIIKDMYPESSKRPACRRSAQCQFKVAGE